VNGFQMSGSYGSHARQRQPCYHYPKHYMFSKIRKSHGNGMSSAFSIKNRYLSSALFANEEKNSNRSNENDDDETQPGRFSIGRIGGRAKRPRQPLDVKDSKKFQIPGFNLIQRLVQTLFILWILKSILFGLLFPSSSVMYYQSSVYESRSYGSNGQVETVRKENFRTNIPSLQKNNINDSSTTKSSNRPDDNNNSASQKKNC
jgi:hypothetical protein